VGELGITENGALAIDHTSRGKVRRLVMCEVVLDNLVGEGKRREAEEEDRWMG
jgi:hypothetical protein